MASRFASLACPLSLLLVLTFSVSSFVALVGEDKEPDSEYLLRSFVVGSAGITGQSNSYISKGTLGQSTPIGIGYENGLVLYSGFWKSFLLFPASLDSPPLEGFTNRLLSCSPNPSGGATTIGYSLARTGPIAIQIFDVQGRLARSLKNEQEAAGIHEIVWDGRNDRGTQVPSGIYFYRLKTDTFTSVKRMLVLK